MMCKSTGNGQGTWRTARIYIRENLHFQWHPRGRLERPLHPSALLWGS